MGQQSQTTPGAVSESLWNVTSGVDHMRIDGRADHPSHDVVTQWLGRRYRSTYRLLDCGVMSGVTYEKLRAAGSPVDYVGMDVSRAVIDDVSTRHPDVTWDLGTAFDLRYADATFDVVHARHVIECLPYYETAVREMFRVAADAVVLCLFQVPAEPEVLLRRETATGYIWLNRYAPQPLEALLHSLSARVKVTDVAARTGNNRVYFCEKATSAGR